MLTPLIQRFPIPSLEVYKSLPKDIEILGSPIKGADLKPLSSQLAALSATL